MDSYMYGHVFWITGLSGAGKTTVGTRLYYRLKKHYPQTVLLDGDVIQRLFGAENVDFSKEGRRRRGYQYSELCKLLSSQGITVVCCTLAMFDEVRDWNRINIPKYYEVFIDVDLSVVVENDAKGLYSKYNIGRDAMVGVAYDAELPKNPDVVIHNKMDDNIESYVDTILQNTINKEQKPSYYWDEYYRSGNAPVAPSDFAKFVLEYMQPGKKLIDLGCGNGRDSTFFCSSGLKVTAVDLSADAIVAINNDLPIFAVCDDFVTAKALFCVDYDYCYARWVMHTITQKQQNELFKNIHNALKPEGLFFIEARTINDSKYGLGKHLGDNAYFQDNHYRRFIDPGHLKEQLKNEGFEVIFCEESDRFSVIAGEAPPALIRVVAKKRNSNDL